MTEQHDLFKRGIQENRRFNTIWLKPDKPYSYIQFVGFLVLEMFLGICVVLLFEEASNAGKDGLIAPPIAMISIGFYVGWLNVLSIRALWKGRPWQ